ncbi:MAG TPA: sucrase ferredoxin [Thermoanaerobaculia bacterium]|nr:sucrase ferredoxin [Thermoanaerobaculia bacterium]
MSAGGHGEGRADDPFCSEVARAEAAPLGGTASRADVWLLVEHRGPWGERAVEENDLPAAVHGWMQAQLAGLARGALTPGATTPGAPTPGAPTPVPLTPVPPGNEAAAANRTRGLLIRQEGPDAPALACFLAIAVERRQELYRFSVRAHEELLALDLARMLAGGELAPWRSDERLTLVCGNGRRDRCCARWGAATYRAVQQHLGGQRAGEAWLSTHQGGHRYAATGLWLPEGVAYGFLAPEEAAPLVAARRRGALHLHCYRGRTFDAEPVQAADAMLRQATGEDRVTAWRLASAQEEAPAAWRVDFNGDAHCYTVRVRRGSEEALVSCSPLKRRAIDRFELVSWQRTEEGR